MKYDKKYELVSHSILNELFFFLLLVLVKNSDPSKLVYQPIFDIDIIIILNLWRIFKTKYVENSLLILFLKHFILRPRNKWDLTEHTVSW